MLFMPFYTHVKYTKDELPVLFSRKSHMELEAELAKYFRTAVKIRKSTPLHKSRVFLRVSFIVIIIVLALTAISGFMIYVRNEDASNMDTSFEISNQVSDNPQLYTNTLLE